MTAEGRPAASPRSTSPASPPPPVRILLVGAGVRGRVWARVIAEAPDATLAGIVDCDRERARRTRDAHAPEALADPDLGSALARTEPHAVVVATPPASHHALVSRVLARGLHVLCEKPLSEDLAEVVDLIGRATAARRHLLVGMNFRHLPSSQRIRRYVRSGELGALSHAHFVYHRHRDGNRHDLNEYVMTMAHPMLLEQSIHHFDLLRYCYDAEVRSLVCDAWRPSWSTYRGDCCVSALFRFENGVHASYLGTWTAAWNRMDFRWRSDFERGALIQREQFDDLVRVDFDCRLALRGSNFKGDDEAETPVAEPLEPCLPFVDDTRRLLSEFLRAVRGEVEPVTTARDHVESLLLTQGCIESLETGGWVEMRELRERFSLATGTAPPPGDDACAATP